MSSKVTTPDEDNISQLCVILDINPVIAGNLLEACNNNLQMAVQMHLDSGGAHATTANGSSSDNVRPPIPPKQEVLVENPLDMGFAFRGRQRPVHRSVFDKFRDFAEETREREETGNRRPGAAGPSTRNNPDRKLERLYRPPFDLIFTGSFQSARDAGNSSFKWLMVNIQNANEFACQVLNRDVWSDGKVKEMIKDNFIFWQVYHDSHPGIHYMNLYPVETWPYVAIIDPRTGECLVTWSKLDVACFCDLANVFISQYSTLEDAEKSDSLGQPRKKKKVVSNRSILDADETAQIEAAIHASLSETDKTPDEDHTSNNSDEDLFEMTDSDCEEIDASFEETPVVNGLPEAKVESTSWKAYLGQETDTSCQIRLFAEGSREIVSMPLTSKLKALILYAEEKGFPSNQYNLETHFPKKSLSDMEPLATLKEAGLSARETVYISKR